MNSTEETSSKETVLDAMNRIIEKEKKGVPLTAVEHLAMAGMAMSGIAGSIVQSGSSFSNSVSRAHAHNTVKTWLENGSVPMEQRGMLGHFADALSTVDTDNWPEIMASIRCNTDSDTKPITNKTYIVRHPVSGLLKIGRSRNPEQRIRTLSTQSGAILKTLLIVEADIERELHGKFCDFRAHGEWFDDKEGLISEYASKAKDGAA